jgi:hypothetical protein
MACALIVLAGGGAGCSRASAQGSADAARDASARSLFDEGIASAERGDWRQAEDRFRRALALRDSPVIAFNLTTTLVERGRLIEASELLRKLEREPRLSPELRRSVQDLQAEVTPQIARLRVHVPNLGAGDVVRVDAEPLHEAQLGVEIPVDPGLHLVSLSRSGKSLDARTIELEAATTRDVLLNAPLPAAADPVEVARAGPIERPTPPLTEMRSSDAGGITRQWWFWVGVSALSAAAVATAVIVGAGASVADGEPAYRGDFNPPALSLRVAR